MGHKRRSKVAGSAYLSDAYFLGAYAKSNLGWSLRDASLIVNMVQVLRADAHRERITLQIRKEEKV